MHKFEDFEPTIGIECHVQLLTESKLFSPARSHYGDLPNTNIDIVDIALPGTLPVLNEKAVDFAIRLGLALSCEIRHESVFARKHYFYPDLPKGYQISQFDKPICEHGHIIITVDGKEKRIRIRRIHLEEDAGKSIHVEGSNVSFVDYNRAGTPLLEVVTEPDLDNAAEAMEFIKSLRALVVYLGICDGNMQEGSMRADVNVSVKLRGAKELGTRTETKNINSIRFAGQAIEFESRRQSIALMSGESIKQETRLWDSNLKESRALRSKEEAHDYRYFPDPDLLPLILEGSRIEHIAKTLPELPRAKLARFCDSLGLSEYDAKILVSDKALADYFEKAVAQGGSAKSIANWIINDVLRIIKTDDEEQSFNIESCPITPESIAALVGLIENKTISGKIAKSVFEEMVSSNELDPMKIVTEKGWVVERDEGKLQALIDEVLASNTAEVEKYKSGKTQVFAFLMGQVMKASKGKADPEEATRLLREKLI